MDDEDADAIERRLGRLHGTLTDPAWGAFPFAQETVHTVGDARRLLAEVRRLREENATLRAEVARLRNGTSAR